MDRAIICGLWSAFAYAAADYLSQVAGRNIGAWRSSFYYYVLGLIVLSIWIAVQPPGLQQVFRQPLAGWFASVAAGLLLLTAGVLFTEGLIRGSLRWSHP
jgi:hypothetical protein